MVEDLRLRVAGRQVGETRETKGKRDAIILILKTHLGNIRHMGHYVCDQHIEKNTKPTLV